MAQIKSTEVRKRSAGSFSSIDTARIYRYATNTLVAVAVLYGLVAGLRTVYDLDLGWQLATGRWVVQHHGIPSTDVFSHTAHGTPWIYPVLSGVVFYGLYVCGGYAALSWLTAIATALTAYLVTRQRNITSAILAIIAIPVLAQRIAPRADLFTVVLFAAFTAVLWRYHRHRSGPLWLLPLLGALWVNMHLGFVVGLLLCVGYAALEAAEFLIPARRREAKARLKRALPWLAATMIATFLNPWGPRILVALVRQQQAMQTHSLWIQEWVGLRISWSAFQEAFAWRHPGSASWWLLVVAIVAIVAAAFLRQFGYAILLLLSAVMTIQHVRFEAIFACVVVIVGGGVLSDGWAKLSSSSVFVKHHTAIFSASVVVCFAFTCLAGVRASDLVSNRLYLRTSSENLFGTGLSWWFPERALAFVEREHLPGNVFNDYNVGGYLIWRLPQYPDYVDGRAIPFGAELFKHAAYELPQYEPDSPAWQEEAATRGINTIIVSIANGTEHFPKLRAFCDSQTWRAVYIDEVSAVFVRRTPETQALVDRLQINCRAAVFTPSSPNANTARERAEAFNFWLNSALVLANLDRGAESVQALDRAQELVPDNNNVHYMRAIALVDSGKPEEAENELRRAIDLQEDETTWFTLARLLVTKQQYPEAAQAARKAADLSPHPQQIYLWLGRLYLETQQPRQALEAFDNATRFDIFATDSQSLGAEFHAQVAEGKAVSWWALGDRVRAIQMAEQAALRTPQNAARWKQLAAMYQAVGRMVDAQRALARAQ